MNLITAVHLNKTFGATQAVSDVNLSIAPGEIYGLVGSDGAGKTTTLRLLVGALQANRGTASICGYDIRTQGEQARAQVGYLSQRFSLYEELTVLENIRFFAELRGMPQAEWYPRCLEILSFVGLAEYKDRRAGQLSGGMKQKLGLASALVSRPRVLLLDEPTTGVDPVTRQDFWQLIIRIVGASLHTAPPSGGPPAGLAVLLTTPYMDEASRCHRVGFMRAGQIIVEGSPTQLRLALEDRIVEVRGPSLHALRPVISRLAGVEDVRAFGDKLHLRLLTGQTKSVISAIHSTHVGVLARPVPPTLEDVFIALSQG